ncbi:conserved hypothetical protein [Bordetella bronchiseptica MO149]|nr:CoA-transferase family III protein [Bordetella bronchiseptica 7E71]RSB97411.1 CoA transferase [Bordetella bronchiseptica]RSC06462.1 CoA transferase [Bordetella bronchiseptica]CCJ57271.1 conserved hypothetical protein [Bordetella bronchiseptica MO149]
MGALPSIGDRRVTSTIPGSPALDGLVVLDISRVLAGPLAGQILGDHGANVIKVESFNGDDTRGYGPPFVGEDAAYFLGLNRNKRSIAVDLSRPQGRDLLLDMVLGADVLIENFKRSTWRKWGITDFGQLSARNPRLVHCRISGFGDDGQLGGMPGYDAAVQALTGFMTINGPAEADPTKLGVPIIDVSTGLNAAIAISLALFERSKSGKGQLVEVSLFDTALAILHPHAANVLAGGKAERSGNLHPNIYPYDLFPTRTADIYLAVGNDGQFRYLCKSLGCPQLADDGRFSSNRLRVANRAALREILTQRLQDVDGSELFQGLLKNGVPCAPVHSVQEALELEHLRQRDGLVRVGEYQGLRSPIRMQRTPPSVRARPPGIGEHTDELLGELGLPPGQIARLVDEGVVKVSKERA